MFSSFWFPASAVSTDVPRVSGRRLPELGLSNQSESFPDHNLPLHIPLKFILQWASNYAHRALWPLPASSKGHSKVGSEMECTDRQALRLMDLRESLCHQGSSCQTNASWMRSLPYHVLLSMSLHQLETEYKHHCLFLAKCILIKAVTMFIHIHVWWFICCSDSFSFRQKIQSLPYSAGRCAKPQVKS